MTKKVSLVRHDKRLFDTLQHHRKRLCSTSQKNLATLAVAPAHFRDTNENTQIKVRGFCGLWFGCFPTFSDKAPTNKICRRSFVGIVHLTRGGRSCSWVLHLIDTNTESRGCCSSARVLFVSDWSFHEHSFPPRPRKEEIVDNELFFGCILWDIRYICTTNPIRSHRKTV